MAERELKCVWNYKHSVQDHMELKMYLLWILEVKITWIKNQPVTKHTIRFKWKPQQQDAP